ncbi:MAG: hypothetical protein AAF809_07300 [Bacteroidota bacterium]
MRTRLRSAPTRCRRVFVHAVRSLDAVRWAPVVLAALLLGGPTALAQLAEGGARALALGRATVALGDDAWGHYNPATWSTLDQGTVALFASQPFGLAELRIAGLAAAYPTPYGTAALTARTYGFEDYRETTLGLGLARAVPLSRARRLHLGVHARLHTLSISEGFGSSNTLTVSAGALVQVVEGVQFGVHARNALAPRDADAKLDAPISTEPGLGLGLAYTPIPDATVLLAIDKSIEDQPASVRGGLEVRPIDVLAIRAGFTTAPARLSLGVGVNLTRVQAALAFENHDALGWTPAVDLTVRF